MPEPKLRSEAGSAREPTSRLEPPACSLRVITQALQGCAQACKSPIPKRLSLLGVAACCTVLHSRWYQSGINRGIASSQYCSLAHASEVRPAPRWPRLHTAYPRALLPLDALYGPQHRRRNGSGIGLSVLSWRTTITPGVTDYCA